MRNTKNIAASVISLIKQENPTLYNLNYLKNTKYQIKKSSHEQNTRRLLDNNPISAKQYASAVLSLFNIKSCALVVDRTNWQYGNIDYNLLVLSVIWNDISIPIHCLHLDNNGGNSNSGQRIELIEWFTKEFPNIKIEHSN